MTKQKLQLQIDEAHRRCNEWEKNTFYLGSAAYHCGILVSFAADELQEALKTGLVQVETASDYYPPRFVIKDA